MRGPKPRSPPVLLVPFFSSSALLEAFPSSSAPASLELFPLLKSSDALLELLPPWSVRATSPPRSVPCMQRPALQGNGLGNPPWQLIGHPTGQPDAFAQASLHPHVSGQKGRIELISESDDPWQTRL